MNKKIFSIATFVVAGCALLSSCMTQGASTGKATAQNGVSTGAAVASALLANSSSPAASTASSILSAVNNGSLISGVIGLLTGGNTTASTVSIVGTWTYKEPTVQFQSQNLLAQAGGVLAAQTAISKLNPYYEKVGFKAGVMKLTFAANNSCTIVLGSKTINGTYKYNASANTVTITDQLGLLNMSAYVTLSSNQLALTLDSSKLLTLTTALGAGSTNAALSSISNLAGNYSGMKTGFLFTR